MIGEKEFARIEVMELVQSISHEMHERSLQDCKMALAVVMAFCIDASKNKSKAKTEVMEMLEFILARASESGAMDKINKMFGEGNEQASTF